MREVPAVRAIVRHHIWWLIAAMATSAALYCAGHLLGNWSTIAKVDALFLSAPTLAGLWIVVFWGGIVGAGHALFLGEMIKELYGERDDIYRHFMAKGDPFLGIADGAAERVLAIEALEGVLTVTYRLVFCVALPVTVASFITGYDTHANAVIFGAVFAGFAFLASHSRGTPLSRVSTWICGIVFLIVAESFGLATAFLLAVVLEVTQALTWYAGKRVFWLLRRLHEEKMMKRSRVKLLFSWGLEMMYILRLKRRPLDPLQEFMAMMVAQAEARQGNQCGHKH